MKHLPLRALSIGIATFLIAGLAWHLVTALGLVSPLFLPAPGSVWDTFVKIAFQDGYKNILLWEHLGVSLSRVGFAFLLALVTAVPLGLLSGMSSVARSVLSPLVYFYRPLPPLAYYTILVIWLGIGESSKLALLYLAGFAPIYISSMSAVGNVDPARLKIAAMLDLSWRQRFLYVVFPSCLPEIFTGMRTAFGFIYTTLVAAEMVAARSGVGWMVLDASKFLLSDVMFVGIIWIGLTGVLIDLGFVGLERLLIPWKGKGNG